MNGIAGMDRRLMLQSIATLIGAGAVAGFDSAALAKAAAAPRTYLDAQAYELLAAVADTLVPRTDTPGALDAKVPATFDALLANWASGQHRYELTHALAAIDEVAQAKAGASFVSLSPDKRTEVLKAHDAEALKPAKAGSGVGTAITRVSAVDPAYQRLKELLVTLYFISQPALTSILIYEHAPGTWQPSIPVTPETRPAGGIGMF